MTTYSPTNSSTVIARPDETTANWTWWTSARWGPIWAGVVAAIGTQFVLTLLGIAIGMSVAGPVDVPTTPEVETLGMAAAIWWVVSGLVSFAVGGMVLGRLSRLAPACPLHLNAFAMWAVVAIFGFAVIWSGAGIVSDAASPLAALSVREAPTEAQLLEMTRGTSANTDATASAVTPAEREELAAAARTHAESAREAAQTASWWAVIAMLLGIGASLAGAAIGAKASERAVWIGPRVPVTT